MSASPTVESGGTSTTPLTRIIATEAETGVLDGAVCSFDPDTQVLMADGTTKAIKDVAIGDSVEAADASPGHDQGGRSVTALHKHQDDDLIDVSVTDRGGKLHVIHTTARHPFWEDTSQTWMPAGTLRAGQELRTVDGREIVIVDVPIAREFGYRNAELMKEDLTGSRAYTKFDTYKDAETGRLVCPGVRAGE